MHFQRNAIVVQYSTLSIYNEDLNVFTTACMVLNPDQNYQNYHLRQRVLNDL